MEWIKMNWYIVVIVGGVFVWMVVSTIKRRSGK